jgi:hypothetical protein
MSAGRRRESLSSGESVFSVTPKQDQAGFLAMEDPRLGSAAID